MLLITKADVQQIALHIKHIYESKIYIGCYTHMHKYMKKYQSLDNKHSNLLSFVTNLQARNGYYITAREHM